jgi:hypothetical protein
MDYSAADAQQNMEDLVNGMEHLYDELNDYYDTPGLSTADKNDINYRMAKLSAEIHHTQLLTHFDAASTPVIREPTDAEVNALANTLTNLGRDLDQMNNVKAVIKFVEEVMTQNAQRLIEIRQTIAA